MKPWGNIRGCAAHPPRETPVLLLHVSNEKALVVLDYIGDYTIRSYMEIVS